MRWKTASYREATSELFATVTALGLQLVWYTKGASIRLKTPDRYEPSIGEVFLEGGQWSGARHVTFGVDPGTLKNHPTVAAAITAYCEKLKAVPGGQATAGVLNAVIFEPEVFPGVEGRVFELLGQLKKAPTILRRVESPRREARQFTSQSGSLDEPSPPLVATVLDPDVPA